MVSNAGIPILLILILCIVWIWCHQSPLNPFSQIPTPSYLLYKDPTELLLLTILGILARPELPGYRVVIETRKSNPNSKKSSSHRSQYRPLNEEKTILEDEHGGNVVKRFQIDKSASSMDRESLDEIIDLAEKDEFDILMYWRVHRMTRANPWDTMEFIETLRKNNIILYFDNYGYIDWDDTTDFRWLVDEVKTARDWRDSIEEGRENNSGFILEQDEWPYGPIGYGLRKEEAEDDDSFYLDEEYTQVIENIFELAETYQDAKEIKERLKTQFSENELEEPSEDQIKRVLKNDLFAGRVTERGSGELVKTRDDIKLVEGDRFDRIHEGWFGEDDDDDENSQLKFGPWDFPAPLFEIIARLGVEYVIRNIKSLRWCCPKCGSIELNISKTTVDVWGIILPKLYCKEDDCGYTGPPIRVHDFEKIDRTWPLICSSCSRVNRFDVRELDMDIPDEMGVDNETDSLYMYKCNECSEIQILPKDPNTVKRAIEKPNLSLRINHDDATNSTNEIKPPEKTSKGDSSDQSQQSTFDSYA